VYPVAGTVDVARDAGAKIVIVNAQPTPFDDVADAVLHQPIGETLPRFL
jgi:NAD-dependent deacetylase